GPGRLPRGAARLRAVPRRHRGGVPGLAAANPRLAAGEPGPPLPGHLAARRAAGAPPGDRAGAVLAGARPRAGGGPEFAEPAGRPPRAVGVAGRGAGAPARGVARAADLAPPGGAEFPGGGAA